MTPVSGGVHVCYRWPNVLNIYLHGWLKFMVNVGIAGPWMLWVWRIGMEALEDICLFFCVLFLDCFGYGLLVAYTLFGCPENL